MTHEYNEGRDFKDDMTFGQFIKKKRRLMGLNQTDFADLLGVNQGTESAWEIGERSPTVNMARLIVAYLGGEMLIVNRSDESLL